MSQNILVIHGFNSGPGIKSEILEKEFPKYNVYSPQLTHKPLEDFRHLYNYINNNKDIHIVGTSLGGFYALNLALSNDSGFRDDLHFYIINPSIRPYDKFKDLIGEKFINYKTSEPLIIDKEFVNGLELLQDNLLTRLYPIPNAYYYLGLNDEVIDHSELKNILYSFSLPINLVVDEQDHRYDDISKIVNQIRLNNIL